MTFFDQLLAAVACTDAPYTAPCSREFAKSFKRQLGVLPLELRGLWCLISELQNAAEMKHDAIRRQEFGYGPEEAVRDDHDNTEATVFSQLMHNPEYQTIIALGKHTTALFSYVIQEAFPYEVDLNKTGWQIDNNWMIWLPDFTHFSRTNGG